MATKRYLFTPGPTPVPPEVLAAVGAPVIHHRSPEFLPVYERVLTRLREVCRTENDVLLFGASGTGAFESAVANLVSPGERHLVVSAGSFGERWVAMTTAFGADVDVLRYAWGETPDADDLRARLAEQEAKAVWFVQSETSTGVVADVRALAAVGEGGGSARGRRRGLEPRRRPLRDRRVGPRRRRLRLAEGAHVPARARPRRGLGRRAGRAQGRRRASTSTGSGRARRSRSSTRRSRCPSRWSPGSTSRSSSCSRRAWRLRSSATSGSAGRRAPA